MKKILTALAMAATLAAAAVATSGTAEARWGGGWQGLGGGGWHGGGWGGEPAVSPPARWSAARSLGLLLPLRLLPVRIWLWRLSASLLRSPLRVAAGMERLRLGPRLRLTGKKIEAAADVPSVGNA